MADNPQPVEQDKKDAEEVHKLVEDINEGKAEIAVIDDMLGK